MITESFAQTVPVKAIRPAQVRRNEPRSLHTCLQIIEGQQQVVIGRDRESNSRKSFTYDHVFGPESNQEELFLEVALPIVDQFLQGFNGTILAYGQTFSGKTYTMGSSNNNDTPAGEVGMIPRIVDYIFNKLNQDSEYQYTMRVSFLEIYQEQLRDLLMPDTDGKKEISIRENKSGSITLSGIHEQPIKTKPAMIRCLEVGGFERTTGDTHMNQHSSRSHAIFTIILEQKDHLTATGNQTPVLRCSKLHLVDLAGSERLKRTGAEGVRLKESVKINSGLLALGNVISVLGSDKAGKNGESERHVPYRDSKLTRLLQDSLGGNSRTVMIACVSPLLEDMDETLNTLKYAYRARKIQNKPIINTVDQQALEMSSMHKKIAQLENQLTQAKTQSADELSSSPVKAAPETVDFDNEVWMQHFMEELKNRTIRGTNAVKALEKVNQEKATLETALQEAESRIQKMSAQIELVSLQNQIEESSTVNQEMKRDFEDFMDFVACIFRGEYPSPEQEERVLQVVLRYRPNEQLKPDSGTVANPIEETNNIIDQFPVHTENVEGYEQSLPVTNPHARTQRRLRRNSPHQEQSDAADSSSQIHLRPLEQEVHGARLEMVRIQSEWEATQEALLRTETQLTGYQDRIDELESLNEKLSRELMLLQQQSSNEVVSVKIVNDVQVQTGGLEFHEPSDFPIHQVDEIADPSPFVVHTNPEYERSDSTQEIDVEGQIPSREKLVKELNTAMKAKVELLRELTRVNKETEKMKHSYMDTVQKLERELEVANRDLTKLHSEQLEKDSAREKSKEEYERKLKSQESSLIKMKNKLKEMERANRDKDQTDRRAKELTSELDKLTAQLTALKRKTKEDSDRFAETDQKKSKEIASLNKQLEDDSKKIRGLEGHLEMMRKKVDRKTEEIAILSRKLRDAGGQSMSFIGGAGSVKSLRFGSQHGRGAHDRNHDETSTQFSHPDGEPTEIAYSEADLRQSPTQDFPANTMPRSKSYDIERYHSLNTRLKEMRTKLAHVETQIKDTEEALDTKPQNQEAYLTELKKLRKSRTILVKSIVDIRTEKQKVEAQIDNDPREGERGETLDIDYQKLTEKFVHDPEVIELIPRLRVANLEESKIQVIQLLDRIQSLKESQRGETEGIEKPPVVSHVSNTPSQTEIATSSTQVQTDRVVQDRVQNLERDVFYYRNANKDLKSKLREVVALNHKLAKSLQDVKIEKGVAPSVSDAATVTKKLSSTQSSPKKKSKDGNVPAFPVAVE